MSAWPTGDYFLASIKKCEGQGHPALFTLIEGIVSPQSNRFASYLKARRSQLRPEEVGYPSDPGRRVSGLKREEVAELAGISLEYYTRLEQGQDYQLSEQVLAGLTRALQLDADAAEYFYRLALPSAPVSRPDGPPELSDLILHLVDGWSHVPVFIEDRNLDILMANDLSREIFPWLLRGRNAVLSAFAVPPEIRALPDWLSLARSSVAALRFQGDPSDPRLQEIVGELSVREPLFRELWADFDARRLDSGAIDVFVAGFGAAKFDWQVLNLPGGLYMVVWAPAPGSLAANAIDHVRARLRDAEPMPVELDSERVA
jgi:transcriptional regulator with XRE-family HTH domain